MPHHVLGRQPRHAGGMRGAQRFSPDGAKADLVSMRQEAHARGHLLLQFGQGGIAAKGQDHLCSGPYGSGAGDVISVPPEHCQGLAQHR